MDTDNNVPLALRRERRSNFGVRVKTEPDTLPEVKTPRRTDKKKVRFSAPGALTSGLTPMFRRTALSLTPSSRRQRASMPANTRPDNTPTKSSSSSESTSHGRNTQCLHNVLDGRVERRLRRSALRSAFDKLDAKHQRSANQAKSQISQLQGELRARDREIYELQNATIIVDTDRIWELEDQVERLQRELKQAQQQQQQQQQQQNQQNQEKSTFVDWTLAARDPFEGRSQMDIDAAYESDTDEEMFGEATMAQLDCGTPSRAQRSFPTPPSTSPLMQHAQMTPSYPRSDQLLGMPPSPTSAPAHVGVQTSFTDIDPDAQTRREELESLQRETGKLNTTLDSYKQMVERLTQRLPADSQTDETNEQTVEHQVEKVLQNLSDRTAALEVLTNTITSLGFSGNDASEMLASVSSAIRNARLELEYITPGEITLPLTSRGAEVLDLLLVQLRTLARKVKENDDQIDEYHALELSLRKQLDARVSVMDELKGDLSKAEGLLGEKESKIRELEIGNDRLKGAIEGYVRDMAELEKLVERMESESASKDTTLSSQQATITDLEKRLKAATKRASDLQDELEVSQATRKKQLVAINRRSGDALALRDARVTELRGEIDRVNGALRDAHERIRKLRVNHGNVEEDNKNLKAVVEGMKGELQRVMRMSEDLVRRDNEEEPAKESVEKPATGKMGGLLSGKLARRSSAKKRRRPDSGLGFLDEDEVSI